MKHTPGPWEAVQAVVTDPIWMPSSKEWCVIAQRPGASSSFGDVLCTVSETGKEHDARLIAAAPELLAALMQEHCHTRVRGEPLRYADCPVCELIRRVEDA